MLTIRLKASLGDDVAVVAAEMVAFARNHSVMVEVQFNDVRLLAHPGDEPSKLVEFYGNPPKWACKKWSQHRSFQDDN